MEERQTDTRRGGRELGIGNLGFSVSRSHNNTFSGFGSFYSFFVQIKIDSRLVIMQSNPNHHRALGQGKRREGKEALTGQSGAPRPPRLSSPGPPTANPHTLRGNEGPKCNILRTARRNIGCGA
jgi:hypothetical protein